MAEEEGTNERCNVKPIRIGISQNTHLLITQAVQVITRRINAQRHRYIVYLLRGKYLSRIDLPGIQDLAPKREDCLKLSVSCLFCRATGGVPLYEKKLAARRILNRAVG